MCLEEMLQMNEMGVFMPSTALSAGTVHLASLHESGGGPGSYCLHFTMRKLAIAQGCLPGINSIRRVP